MKRRNNIDEPEYCRLVRATKSPPDLDIGVYDVRGNKGTIFSKAMKCEFPSGNIARDVGKLAKEWLDLREAYR